MNKWRAVYSESCKYGSGASAGKPNLVISQGVWHLAYYAVFIPAVITIPSAIATKSAPIAAPTSVPV